MRNGAKLKFSLLFLAVFTCGCAILRTEFYRGETRYIYNRGCQQYRQGDYDVAREDFKKVLALDPDYGPAYGALGNIALAEGLHEAAFVYYRSAIQVDPELENDLRPYILIATAQATREPMIRAGIDLRRVYQLMMVNKQAELEILLSNDIPLDLLAKDTLSVTSSELGELRNKVAANTNPAKGSISYRLFSAYFLFYSQEDPILAAALIDQAIPDAKIKDRKKAYVILGQIRERLGDFNLAVDAYIGAVNAGVPLADVANHLSRIYGLEVESVLSRTVEPKLTPRKPQTLQLSLSLPASLTVPSNLAFEQAAPDGFLNK